MNNHDIDKQLEFLRAISAVQVKLFRPGIESEFPDPEQKKRFKKHRLNWSLFVETVEIDISSVLVNELEANEVGLLSGIAEINQQIQEIDDTVGFLKLLGETLKIIDRVVQLLI